MFSRALYLACFIALALNPSAVYSLPIPPSASTVLPVRFGAFDRQRPFARPTPPAKLRFAPEEHDSPSAAAVFSPSPASSASFTNIDTIFADSLQAGGVEASLAAVLASRQMQRVDGLRRDALAPRLVPGVNKVVKRDWVVPGRPTAAATTTSSSLSSSAPTASSTATPSSAASTFSSTEMATPSPIAFVPSPAPAAPTTTTATPPSAPSDPLVWYHAPEPTLSFDFRSKSSFGGLGSLQA
ncbi:hypothetical protein JCM6882_004531 [Rhodosporidiobolus microsporus]